MVDSNYLIWTYSLQIELFARDIEVKDGDQRVSCQILKDIHEFSYDLYV